MKAPSIVLHNKTVFMQFLMKLPIWMLHIEAARFGRDTETYSHVFLWRDGYWKPRLQSIVWMLRHTNKSVYRAIVDGLFN